MGELQENILAGIYIFFKNHTSSSTISHIKIAENLRSDPQAVMAYVQKLETLGYIKTLDASTLKEDKRLAVTRITASGTALAQQIIEKNR